jgi:fucose 4-O-acetylase-like acetyltransferase
LVKRIARLNLPAVFVYGGTILPGKLDGKDLDAVSAFEGVHTTTSTGPWTSGTFYFVKCLFIYFAIIILSDAFKDCQYDVICY